MWLCKLLHGFCKKGILIHITEEARLKAGSNRFRDSTVVVHSKDKEQDKLSNETKRNIRTYNYLNYMMKIYLILVLLSL